MTNFRVSLDDFTRGERVELAVQTVAGACERHVGLVTSRTPLTVALDNGEYVYPRPCQCRSHATDVGQLDLFGGGA